MTRKIDYIKSAAKAFKLVIESGELTDIINERGFAPNGLVKFFKKIFDKDTYKILEAV